jgi:glucose/arabinose dehydrogenase
MRRYALLLIVLAAAPAARGQTVPDGFIVETMISSLSQPVAFDFLPDGRVIFAEQATARLRILKPPSTLQANPVISITGVATGGERGLLGVALDPNFPSRPYVYVHYTVATPAHIRIARYTLSGDLLGNSGADLVADPASRYDLVDDIPDAAPNHNGGTVRFGVEGPLYVSLGEDANMCAAQGTTSLRGVLLRLRTSTLPPGPGSAFRAQVTPPDNPFVASADSNSRLVAAYGLRNPFRFQVDKRYGFVVIGDVGATTREELDLLAPAIAVPAYGAAPPPAAPLGSNFGWPFREGTVTGPTTCGPQPPNLVEPIYDYDRTQQPNGASIISAGMYRQQTGGVFNWPADHDGDIFANDYYTGDVRRVKFTGSAWGLASAIPGQPTPTTWGAGFSQVSDWRVHPDGSLWYCKQSVNFTGTTGSFGRIRGPGLLGTPPGARLALRLVRSPAVGFAELRVTADADVDVRIIDTGGRTVRTLWDGAVSTVTPGSEFPLRWDGLTDDGEQARPGMYLALVKSGTRRAAVRVPFLR